MGIHQTALIDNRARIGADVEIGPFTIVHANVVIGNGSKIGSHCEIGVPTPLGDGSPLVIGSSSNIRSHSVFYESSSFGNSLTTGHRVTVRELTRAGESFQIGTLGDIQGRCQIGNHVRFQSNVFVGQHATIEDFVWAFPHVVFTNDPHPPSEVMRGVTIRRFAAIAAMSTIFPGVRIGEGALVGACSAVTKDVDDHRIVAGNPATDRGPTSRIKLKDGTGRNAYPWTTHFSRGYPEDIVTEWLEASKLA
jgi:acyl-[acyl carrier protein]--UDP-N-acetylglucosamine O-acyltransferase